MNWFKRAARPQMSLEQALQVFGYPPGSKPSPDEIKKKYRELARQSHPDLGHQGGNIAQVNNAYEVLKATDFTQPTPGFQWGTGPFRGQGPRTNEETGRRNHPSGETPAWDAYGPSYEGKSHYQGRQQGIPEWQTDERSSYNQVNENLGFRDKNYCLKNIWEHSKVRADVAPWDISAFDGYFFRGMFTAKTNQESLGYVGNVMTAWNSHGANPYATAAVIAAPKGTHRWQVIQIKGQDVTGKNLFIESEGVPWNSRQFTARLQQILAEHGFDTVARKNLNWYMLRFADDGTTGAFLTSRGVPGDVIQFVLGLTDMQMKNKMVSILAKNPQTTMVQLQQMVPQKVQQAPNDPQELQLAQRFQNPEFQQWLLVNLRKARNAAQMKGVANPSEAFIGDTGIRYLDPKIFTGGAVPLDEMSSIAGEVYDWFENLLLARQALQGGQAIQAVRDQYGILNPNENLANLTLGDAYWLSNAWHELMEGKGDGTEYFQEKPEHTVFGPKWSNPEWTGWTIKQVMSKNNLLAEGNKVGHCVGGESYCRAVERGDTRIFSLRDPQNVPYVTMEVEPTSWNFKQLFGNGPKTGNSDPHDNLKAMIGEWMKTLPGVSIEGANDYNYGELGYRDDSETFENIIFGGLEGYGIQKDMTSFNYEDAYNAVTKAKDDRRDSHAPRDTGEFAEILARAAVAADMARIKAGKWNQRAIAGEALGWAQKDRKNYAVKDLKRIPPEALQAIMQQVNAKYTDAKLMEDMGYWARGKHPHEVKARFDQRRSEIALERYNNELKYPNLKNLNELPPDEIERWMSFALDKRSEVAAAGEMRQTNDENFSEHWDGTYVNEDEYEDPEEFEKARAEAEEADGEEQDYYRKQHLPYALDDKIFNYLPTQLKIQKLKIPRWIVQRWGKGGSHRPYIMWEMDRMRRPEKQASVLKTASVFRCYHGTGNVKSIQTGGFHYQFAGMGQEAYGPGFYFTTNPKTAEGYTIRRLEPELTKPGGEDNPGVIVADVTLNKPIVASVRSFGSLDWFPALTRQQATALVLEAVKLNPGVMEDWGDPGSTPRRSIINQMINGYTNSSGLIAMNDLFRSNTEQRLRIYSKVTGYDGVIADFENGEMHVIAWFPEQIKIVQEGV